MGYLKDDCAYFTYEELKKWGRDVLALTEMSQEEIDDTIEALLLANLRGIDTHGITMLPSYAERYKVTEHSEVAIERDTGPGCLIDGGNHTGQHVSMVALREAMKRAEKYGIGVAMMKEMGHAGAIGNFLAMAAEQGYIGLCSCNSMSLIAPWGGLKATLGNAPFAIAFPYKDRMPIVLDVATSVVARQKIYNYRREGKQLPDGWALDKEGNPTNDPQEALDGLLMAIGAHKGTGIALLTDLILGTIAGGAYSESICANVEMDRPQHISQMIFLIKADAFVDPDLRHQLVEAYMDRFNQIPVKKGIDKLMLPGEMEWGKRLEREKTGIPITLPRLKEMQEYSEKVGISCVTWS